VCQHVRSTAPSRVFLRGTDCRVLELLVCVGTPCQHVPRTVFNRGCFYSRYPRRQFDMNLAGLDSILMFDTRLVVAGRRDWVRYSPFGLQSGSAPAVDEVRTGCSCSAASGHINHVLLLCCTLSAQLPPCPPAPVQETEYTPVERVLVKPTRAIVQPSRAPVQPIAVSDAASVDDSLTV